jgi:hypothetical protein
MAKRKKPTGSVRRDPPAKARKGHGGARDRAGRPPLLSWEQETWFCAHLENRLNEIAEVAATQKGHEAERRRAKRRDSSLSFDPIEQLNKHYTELREVPLSERRKRAKLKTELGEGDHLIDDKIGDIRDLRRLLLRDEVSPPHQSKGDLFTYHPIHRPKGVRDALIRETIALIEERYGVKVSPDYVKLRWKEYRRDLGLKHRRPKPGT